MPDASGSRYPRVFSAKRARHLLPQGKPQDNQGKWGGRFFCSLAPFTAQRKSCWIHNLLKITKSKQLISELGYSVVLLSFLVAINIKKEISLLIDCYKMLHWLWRRTFEEKELIFIVLVITPNPHPKIASELPQPRKPSPKLNKNYSFGTKTCRLFIFSEGNTRNLLHTSGVNCWLQTLTGNMVSICCLRFIDASLAL